MYTSPLGKGAGAERVGRIQVSPNRLYFPVIKSCLFFNAAVYLLLVLRCTFKHNWISRASGFLTLDNSGHSEYLVINGGLQLGLALFFAYLGASAPLHRTGLIFSLLLYLPIVLYRIATIVACRPVGAVTLATAALELTLLTGAAVLFFRSA